MGSRLNPRIPILFISVLVMVTALVVGGLLIFSAPKPVAASPVAMPAAQEPDNSVCLACHTKEGQTYEFANGDIMSISVDPDLFAESTHASLSCQTCHVDISKYPHPEVTAQSQRDYTLQYKDTCKNCHGDQTGEYLQGVHSTALEAGNQNSAACSDCHNPHTKKPFEKDASGRLTANELAEVANICAKCHSAIDEQYRNSVHGEGIIEDKNPDVPTCTDCHGVHNISGPGISGFRLTSPDICARCHTDAAIMDKYGLSTQVLNTYIADFHGTTVTMFEKLDPDQQTNKPVCYDCHGVHDIRAVDDPQKGLQVKENMLAACQRCHPDATANFPDSWLSHYIPTPDKYPLVYYVSLFYKIFIPAVLGTMGIYVLSDIYRKIRASGKKSADVAEKTKHETVIPPTDEKKED